MNLQALAAILLILGFVFILVASTVGPPRLYQEPDIDAQLELIAGHTPSWVTSNVFFGLGGLVTAVGLILFSIQPRQNTNIWLGVSMIVGMALRAKTIIIEYVSDAVRRPVAA